MARSKRTRNAGQALMKVGGALIGGVVGNQVTTQIENVLLKSGTKNPSTLAPIAAIAAGTAIMMFGGEKIQSFGLGMAATAGTESIEGLIARATAPKTTIETTETTQGALQRYNASAGVNSARERTQVNKYNKYMSMSY